MSIHDAIDINHGNNIKNIIFPQKLAFFCLSQEFFNHTLAHKRSLSLSRMLSSHYNDGFPGILFLYQVMCNFQTLNGSFGYSFSDCNFFHYISVLGTFIIDVVVKLCVGVRIWMSDVKFVTWVFRNYLKGEFVIMTPGILSGQNSFFVRYLQTHSFPDFFRLSSFLTLY